jgi:hypothetical protein
VNIRLLNADEIDARVQSVKKTNKGVGCIVLLYKDARCDMKILDETFGMLGWEREHQLINGNLFCTVKVWDMDNQRWVSKQDVGTESNTEKEKGQASDAFKRACFNIGIGRELYTSPFIWIDLKEGEYNEYNGKTSVSAFVKFSVKSIGYNDQREITSLEITDNKGNVRYSLKSSNKPVDLRETPSNTNTLLISKREIDKLISLANGNVKAAKEVMLKHGYTESKQIKKSDYETICEEIQKAVS